MPACDFCDKGSLAVPSVIKHLVVSMSAAAAAQTVLVNAKNISQRQHSIHLDKLEVGNMLGNKYIKSILPV